MFYRLQQSPKNDPFALALKYMVAGSTCSEAVSMILKRFPFSFNHN